MIQFNDLFNITADSFFNGDIGLAGVVILIVILAGVMAFSKKMATTLLLAIPLIMIFAYMGFIPQEIGLVMLLVVSLMLALFARGVFE